MKSAREELSRLLDDEKIEESEARLLLNELIRRRAERKDPLMWWIQKTS